MRFSHRLRRCAAALALSALLLPATALHAAQRHRQAAPVSVERHHPLIEFLLHFFFDAGPGLDGNG
jgi:hypothetical protein